MLARRGHRRREIRVDRRLPSALNDGGFHDGCSFLFRLICAYRTYIPGSTVASRKKVQNTHIRDRLRELHGAVLDIVSAMNRPQRDEVLIKEAGIALDRALFPLLVGVQRFGPIGVVDLADRAGRDYTTVSG